MSSILVTGITTMTTISAITLADDFSLQDLLENVKELGGWINSWLPKNVLIRTLFYGAGVVVSLRMVPFMLRKTKFFYNVEIQNRYFHRATSDPKLMEIKLALMENMNNKELPLSKDGKTVILELNAGGGSNINYYPDGCVYIATDYWEGAKDHLEQNFPSEQFPHRITYDRFVNTIPDRLLSVPDCSVSAVVSFHSLCSSSNIFMALLEIKRVLIPGGKLFFIEHVRTNKRYSFLWISQLNFALQFLLWNCFNYNTQYALEKAGFNSLDVSEIVLDFRNMGMYGPMYALSPHIYGIATK